MNQATAAIADVPEQAVHEFMKQMLMIGKRVDRLQARAFLTAAWPHLARVIEADGRENLQAAIDRVQHLAGEAQKLAVQKAREGERRRIRQLAIDTHAVYTHCEDVASCPGHKPEPFADLVSE